MAESDIRADGRPDIFRLAAEVFSHGFHRLGTDSLGCTPPAGVGSTYSAGHRVVEQQRCAVRGEHQQRHPGIIGYQGIALGILPMAESGSEYARYAFGAAADGMNMDENLTETVEFVRLLEKLGFELIVGTIGSPYYNVHMQRPAWYAVADGYLMPENPLYNVSRHIAAAKRLKELCPAMKLVASGLTALQEYLPAAAEYIVENNYADFAGIGRMVLSYPQMPADALAGKTLDRRRICRTFGECTNGPRHGMISGCFPLDEFYKKMPQAAALRALKKNQ